MTNLTRWEKITTYIAKWIVVNIACNINASAVLALSIEATRIYLERMDDDN
jgi:hypothetical protein